MTLSCYRAWQWHLKLLSPDMRIDADGSCRRHPSEHAACVCTLDCPTGSQVFERVVLQVRFPLGWLQSGRRSGVLGRCCRLLRSWG